MIKIEPRNTQTRVKHEILSEYLDAWGGIIVGGLKGSRRQGDWHFVYVDCFSYLGKYAGEKEDDFQNKETKTVYGSPIIGIKALDKLLSHAQRLGVSIKVNTILVEKDKRKFDELKITLQESGYSQRVVETCEFDRMINGQISIVNSDSTLIIDSLLAYTTNPSTWAFYLIDPYGPSGIPYNFVQKVVIREHHDVMINFIYEDLPRKGGLALKDDIKPELKLQVDNWTNAFGSDVWIKIAQKTVFADEENIEIKDVLREYRSDIAFSKEEIAAIKEQKFVDAYRNVLHSMDPSLAIKLVNLQFGDKNRTMFYLFLTTHDPTGALKLNHVLSDAKYLEHELRYRLQIAKRTAPPPEQPMLLPLREEEIKAPESEKPPRPSSEEIGKFLLGQLSGKHVTKKDVYKELANTFYFSEEIDKALRYLRREGKAHFVDPLKHKTLINFFN
jgi:three-Cys-motif partner protein